MTYGPSASRINMLITNAISGEIRGTIQEKLLVKDQVSIYLQMYFKKYSYLLII